MRLRRHLHLVQTILQTRQEIEIEYLQVREKVPHREATIRARLRFWNNSFLEFTETLLADPVSLIKTRYTYHYQDSNRQLLFRYDNAPHHPEISTHPHHKHTPEGIVAATPPHLNDVLREIDHHLYPD